MYNILYSRFEFNAKINGENRGTNPPYVHQLNQITMKHYTMTEDRDLRDVNPVLTIYCAPLLRFAANRAFISSAYCAFIAATFALVRAFSSSV